MSFDVEDFWALCGTVSVLHNIMNYIKFYNVFNNRRQVMIRMGGDINSLVSPPLLKLHQIRGKFYFMPCSLSKAEWVMVLDISPTAIFVWDVLFVTESDKTRSVSHNCWVLFRHALHTINVQTNLLVCVMFEQSPKSLMNSYLVSFLVCLFYLCVNIQQSACMQMSHYLTSFHFWLLFGEQDCVGCI